MAFFKKNLITIILLATLSAFAISILTSVPNSEKTKIFTIKDTQTISMESRKTAFKPMLLAPYKTMDVFISEEKKADFLFTSVGGTWKEVVTEGTKVEAEIRFKMNGQWSEWLDLEEENDPLESGRKFAIASSNPAESFQYKYIMYSSGTNTPLVQNSEWTFIKTAKTLSAKPAPKPKYSSNPIYNNITYLALAADPTGVISRSNWGAAESYRYMSDNTLTPVLVELGEEFMEKYGDEINYSRIVEEDENGDKYKWPLQYATNVSKIIIHHTATTKNLADPAQAIRDIYYYHAVTRGWGDIGYNYIVDKEGRIYEGRYGGESVVAAHAGPGNHGSIGIAILGNYQTDPIPENVIAELSRFIYKKTKIHNIDPNGYSEFRGENRPNIFGHRDIMNTTCPGDYLYEKMPVIRVLAFQRFDEKEKFVKKYAYEDQTELYYLELKPEETAQVTLRLENIGTTDWNDETFILVNDNPDFNGIISFPAKENEILAMMKENLVKPGETGTFNFKIKASKTAKTVYMDIALLVNGSQKISDYVVLPVAVEQPVYKYEVADASYPPAKMKSGETFKGWIELKNTGNVIWKKSGGGQVFLHKNEISYFIDPPSSIIGKLEKDTGPGETGKFILDLKAPGNAGYYYDEFVPRMIDAKFSSQDKISYAVTVYEKDYDSKLISKTPHKNWERGKKHDVSIQLRNVGGKNWEEKDLRAVFLKESDLKIGNLKLAPKTVEPGEIGTISFKADIADNEKIENKIMYARVKIKGNPIYIKPLQFKYTITETKFQTLTDDDEAGATGGEKIRIKLSFSGDPEITANGSFEAYSGEDHLITLNAGKTAKVSKVGTKYKVEAGGTIFLKTDPIRFYPKNSAILKISNFEHRPSWSQDLDDNEYRGILEIQEVDLSLVVINELLLEDYLKGLGEEPNDEEMEKIKAIMVAARSYAKYYMDVAEKFPGKPYNLDDDPSVSQKYLGYGFEKRAPNVVAAAKATEGEVITYNGEVVKAPYFSQSDGTMTKSAYEVWGWTHTPYLVSVSDSLCDGDKFLGHGVGMSGCGAAAMAKNGATYKEILLHYYTGIEISDI